MATVGAQNSFFLAFGFKYASADERNAAVCDFWRHLLQRVVDGHVHDVRGKHLGVFDLLFRLRLVSTAIAGLEFAQQNVHRLWFVRRLVQDDIIADACDIWNLSEERKEFGVVFVEFEKEGRAAFLDDDRRARAAFGFLVEDDRAGYVHEVFAHDIAYGLEERRQRHGYSKRAA